MPPEWDQPPPGYQPGQTRAPLVWDIAVPLGVVAVFLACLRFYVRACLIKIFGKDDWLLLAAVLFLCCLVGGEAWGTSMGLGKHQYELNKEINPVDLRPSAAMVIVSYYLCQSCVQCSILAFYLRIGLAETSGNRMRWTIYAAMGFSIVSNTISGCLSLAFTIVESLIIQSNKYLTGIWFTYCSLNLLLDLTIWAIPLPAVFSVMKSLSKRKRILLGMAFAVGMMCWCSAILRISFRKYVLVLGGDPSYNAPIIFVLYVTEGSLAISCVSVATLRPLVVEITKGFNRLRGKPSSKKSRTSASGYEASPGLAQPGGYGPRSGATKATGNKGWFGEPDFVDEEMAKWKNGAVDIQRPELVQTIWSCPRGDDGGGLRSTGDYYSGTRRPDPAWGTQIQFPAPTAISQYASHRSYNSSSSSGETLRTPGISNPHQGVHSWPPRDPLASSFESAVTLTDVDSNMIRYYS